MNKTLILIIYSLVTFSIFAQTKEFKIPGSNDGYLDMHVSEHDTIIINEENAHILSDKTYAAYQQFKDNFMNCLNEREKDIVSIERKLSEINTSIDVIIQQIEKQENISSEVLKNSEIELNNLLTALNSDIDNLNGIRSSINEAESKLATIEKKLKKERTKLIWRKIRDIAIAGGLGILIGAAFFGG